jgi:hypothetical protein
LPGREVVVAVPAEAAAAAEKMFRKKQKKSPSGRGFFFDLCANLGMAKQKFRYTRRSDFLGARLYIWYAECLIRINRK